MTLVEAFTPFSVSYFRILFCSDTGSVCCISIGCTILSIGIDIFLIINVNILSFLSVRTPQLPKAKKKDFHALLHNSNFSSTADDNRIAR